MPPKPMNGVLEPLVDSHEERILRVEGDVSTMREDLTECRSDIRHMQGTLDGVDGKVDELKTIVEKFAVDSAARLSLVLDRVDVLEDDKKRYSERWGLLQKSLLWGFGGAGGVVLAKYGEAFYSWFTR